MNCLSLQLNPKEPFCPNTGRTVLFFNKGINIRGMPTHTIVRKTFFPRVPTFCPSMSISVFLVDQLEVHGGVSAPSAIP